MSAEIRKYVMGTDDDDLTADVIRGLPLIPVLADDFTDEFREFVSEFYDAAYKAGYKTYAGFYRGESTEITYLVKDESASHA